MNAVLATPMDLPDPWLQAAIKSACDSIAPAWPLDRQIAVNPWWGFVQRPFAEVAAHLRHVSGARLVWPAEEYGQSEPPAHGLPLPSDVLDADPGRPRGPFWSDSITQQVSQYCASFFDAHQADWHRPDKHSLFTDWRDALPVDHALETLMRAPQLRENAGLLPTDSESAIAWALQRLRVNEADTATFLQACLWRISGWASWCAYLAWEAALAGRSDKTLQELLAIRVCWEALLPDDMPSGGSLVQLWQMHWKRAQHSGRTQAPPAGLALQREREIAWQDELVGKLGQVPRDATPAASTTAETALVFCIDVRSERLRRVLEGVDPNLATRGFAGFFGLPVKFAQLGSAHWQPMLPGLLAPTLEVSESCGDAARDRRIAEARGQAFGAQLARRPFGNLPSGSFAGVETLGIGRIAELLRRSFGLTGQAGDGIDPKAGAQLRPCLLPAGDQTIARNATLAASALRGMGFTRDLPKLLVLVGHGSQSANNPQAAALDCGACGGHSGETNASVLADLLNDSAVRRELAVRGIAVPADMLAIAALHNTTTDEVQLLTRGTLDAAQAARVQRLREALERAGHLSRRERAPGLGLAALADSPAALLASLQHRARDWSQTRPEWGLAGNAAFVVAPRERTRGIDLAGRAFLHDYDADADTDGSVLELIMTAPMIVTHWINMQYNASTVDPARFGSGNKVLHNVACGRIGVFEGNTGDLRIGLARQSVHDGEKWMHEPLRLTVCIDAPREAIERVIGKHALVRNLVDNEWLYLFRFGDQGMEWRRQGQWETWPTA